METPEVRLAVRQLTEFLQKSGSIDNRYGGPDRGPIGTRIHRQLQREEPGYQAEVRLSDTTLRDGITYIVQGRADGVLEREGLPVIDEIKTTGYPMELVDEEFNLAHWGQGKCYAHFYCRSTGAAEAFVRLTYYQVDTGEIKRFWRRYTAGELEAFYLGLLDEYQKWAHMESDWQAERTASIRALSFPFDGYRPGQRQLAAAVYRTIERGGRLFAQAPTGIGKTMSTLFPSIKAMGEGMGEKIFYLTAKTMTRQAAADALTHLRAGGLRLKSVTLTAKDKICFQKTRDCNPEHCPFADGYYDRLRDALWRMLAEECDFSREIVEKWGREYRLCPFELSLDLTLWCDMILCDYNYLFDPVVYLRRFLSDDGGDFVFLVDEAHNLVDRAREMYTARLWKSEVLALRRHCAPKAGNQKTLYRALGGISRAMTALGKDCPEEGEAQEALPASVLQAVGRFVQVCEEWLGENRASPLRESVLNFYFQALFYGKMAELFDEHYVTYIWKDRKEKEMQVSLLCLDPAPFLDGSMKKGRSTVLFSATFSPADYYISVLGGGETARSCRLESPFPPERLRLLVADRISTKYQDREASILPITEMLHAMISSRVGNYMAYFPSYQYRDEVLEVFREHYPDVETAVQESGMEEAERERFLERFAAGSGKTLLGFCVLGGVYSEGIDLKGDRLIGTAVVGVGLPQVHPEQELLRSYFERKYGMGYPFAYRYPGMNKVLQAAGRVIRSEQDRGVVLLIDSRFTTGAYLALFPGHWRGYRTVRSCAALSHQLQEFWAAEGTDPGRDGCPQ